MNSSRECARILFRLPLYNGSFKHFVQLVYSRELLYTPRGKHYPVVTSDDTGVPSTPRYIVEYTSIGQYWPEGDMAFHRRLTIPSLLLYGMKDTAISFVEMCEMEKVFFVFQTISH